VIFGHSFGAVVAYELARRVSDAGLQRRHLVLVVSGAGRPGSGPDELISGLDDDHFLDQVRHRTGYSHPAFDDPEIRDLLLPTLRADIALSERYRPHVIAPLPHPVLTLRGDADELVSAAQAAQWREMTSAEFVMRQLPGGHMYLTESWQQLLDLLRDECLPLLQPTSCPEAQDQAIAEPKHQSTCEAPRREGPYGDVID
jgi:surfactin synthase thioesterase subunit